MKGDILLLAVGQEEYARKYLGDAENPDDVQNHYFYLSIISFFFLDPESTSGAMQYNFFHEYIYLSFLYK